MPVLGRGSRGRKSGRGLVLNGHFLCKKRQVFTDQAMSYCRGAAAAGGVLAKRDGGSSGAGQPIFGLCQVGLTPAVAILEIAAIQA